MSLSVIRNTSPRLYHPADDPDYRFAPPEDPVRRRILKNILEDCETFASHKPWKRIPEDRGLNNFPISLQRPQRGESEKVTCLLQAGTGSPLPLSHFPREVLCELCGASTEI